MVVKEHNADGDLIDQTCSEALNMASEIIVGDDIRGVRYDAEQDAQVQAPTKPILPREVSTGVDFDDSISADVSTCESNIFCGNYENLVAHTPFVETKVLEFHELDVCFDGAEGLKVENGLKDLVVCDNEGLKYCCSGVCLERPKFLDGEWSCATLQFGGDIGVHVFDPGIFESDDIDLMETSAAAW
ncbi:hypothetical protein SASPL_121289 [Salvia splendens]|uniref:Uncharacterized protein n=1 Tax=Salvia splendens TaxID=180675 RepID=A0A8X8XS47_SALSN|nr:hypothetical protein SASPL_121289 [Salvia splendens]